MNFQSYYYNTITTKQLRESGFFKNGAVVHMKITLGEPSIFRRKSIVDNEINLKSCYRAVNFIYLANTDDGLRPFNFDVPIREIPCRYGGLRRWFICPLMVGGRFCGRRSGTLYLPLDSIFWGCSKCHKIRYFSQLSPYRLGIYDRDFKARKAEEMQDKIDELKGMIGKLTYKGKPTKKVQKIHKLYRKKYKLC